MTSHIKTLKQKVYDANIRLSKSRLVTGTFGNVSGIDRKEGIIAIKPSGIPYEDLRPVDMVLVYLDGKKVDKASPNPSSDTATHLELFNNFSSIGGVTHSHSPYATAFSQAKAAIPCLGTTHADYFYGAVPVTGVIEDACILSEYEKETGKLIVETFKNRDHTKMKACLVACHGPFTWGSDADDAVEAAIILEYIAMLAYRSIAIDSSAGDIKKTLLDKHYLRKHGKDSYYGQNGR
jgi:L-ribulose-5-phosphate 4-epimerase